MARSRTVRLLALGLSNLLLPIAVLIFATGFFPYKPFLPGLATFEDVQETAVGNVEQPEAVFDRVVFMVVDALRSDFVYGYESGFEFTQGLIRSGAAIPFTAHATPPTVTMPRVKALTTGSVPSFLDLILNFAESDTTSSLATQDTWLAQIKAKGGNLVFYGDDTWLKLFPGDFFLRSDGTSSFFVSDFTEVDNNVTRHIPSELAREDWNAMIMHYLGLDHIGHKTGPQGPNMLPKQREMDGIVKQIYKAMESEEHHKNTLLVLAGDHGMNAGGNHGGSGPGETEPALLFASPKFRDMPKRRRYECPTWPKEGTEFHYYTKIEQSDVVPALAGMMGMPISKNSLGIFIPELAGLWSETKMLELLRQNAEQLLHIIKAKYDAQKFDERAADHAVGFKHEEYPCVIEGTEEDSLAMSWGQVLRKIEDNTGETDPKEAERAYFVFLRRTQEAMSSTASSYDIPRMGSGMGIAAVALALALISFPSLWPPSSSGVFFTMTSLLYGVMMFASSYVEEEQHFWYWLTPAWVSVLAAEAFLKSSEKQRKIRVAIAAAVLLATHRLAVRWNQTGQKHAGEPDVVHTVFPEAHILMWILILATYVVMGFFLHTKTFAGIFMAELAAFTNTAIIVLGIVFKLNFTQADAPELVQGLAIRIREYSEPFDLVFQARTVFALLAGSAGAVVILSVKQSRSRSGKPNDDEEERISLPERLHYLLALFLMTQTRAPNIPLFLFMELQREHIRILISRDDSESLKSSPAAIEVATSALLLSNVYYFCMGGSNSISSIDLSNAYNGVADYNIAAVGVLLFASNWAGPVYWCSAAVLLMYLRSMEPAEKPTAQGEDERDWVMVERTKLNEDAKAALKPPEERPGDAGTNSQGPWMIYISSMTAFIATSLLAVMASCTALRTHLFIWTVFSPKYLYVMAWSMGWHLLINIGFGNLLYRLRGIS